MSKEDCTVTFKGKSGKGYTFEVYSKDTTFNDVSAVYIFAKVYFDASRTQMVKPLYIGESSELGKRIAAHEKWGCANKNGCTHICTLQVRGDSARLDVETDLIRNYNAPCNDQ